MLYILSNLNVWQMFVAVLPTSAYFNPPVTSMFSELPVVHLTVSRNVTAYIFCYSNNFGIMSVL